MKTKILYDREAGIGMERESDFLELRNTEPHEGGPFCNAVSGFWTCTRSPLHTGVHIAVGFKMLRVWEDETHQDEEEYLI